MEQALSRLEAAVAAAGMTAYADDLYPRAPQAPAEASGGESAPTH